MKRKMQLVWALSMLVALVLAGSGPPAQTVQAQGQVTSPDKFFGFRMGADRKVARWDKLVEYYRLLEKESGGKLKVINMGPTEMGNPFLLCILTSAANQANLETLRQNNLKLSDPRGIPEAEARKIAAASRPLGGNDDEHARHRDWRDSDVSRARLRAGDAERS